MKLSISQVKRMKRAAQRANNKLKRKVETVRKLRQETSDLRRSTGFLKDELRELLDSNWIPN